MATTNQSAELAPGTRVQHIRYGWTGTVVKGRRDALASDRFVEVKWDFDTEPRFVGIGRLLVIDDDHDRPDGCTVCGAPDATGGCPNCGADS